MNMSDATTRTSSLPEVGTSTRRRHGSVIVVVLWAIAISALVASAVQISAFRQASLGRDTVQRIQARWAARGGIENAIAMMAIHTENPPPDDAFALVHDLVQISGGQFYDASYDIRYDADGVNWAGPLDEHARLNLNGADINLLEILEDISPDVAASIRDWRDDDDDPGILGAEGDYYLGQRNSYEPRNGPFRHIAELELVAGVWGDFVRGEDWNLNNRKDRNEDDGAFTIPIDQPDGFLETGWAGQLTVHSVDGGATESGLPRIYLRRPDPIEIMERCGVTQEQAEALIEFGQNDQNRLELLLTQPLGGSGPGGQGGDDQTGESDEDQLALDDEQIRAVLAETSVRPLYERMPGRINLNSASYDLIRDLLEVRGLDPIVADEITYLRDSRAEGVLSLIDLKEIPNITPELVDNLSQIFTTSSNVYTISSRGRSVSGIEVEIIAVVDRSSVPVRILEYREQ